MSSEPDRKPGTPPKMNDKKLPPPAAAKPRDKPVSPTETPLVILPDLSHDTEKPKTPPPLMDPAQVEKLNRFMFSYDPYGNRRPVRINNRPYPPWTYLPDILDGRTVEFRYHPDVFKTNLCKNGAECRMRETCPFIHPGERYVPTWRNTGMFFDNIYYPPPPVTYEWFKHLMLEFKTKGPCQMKQDHDYKRCPYWHADLKVLDRREPLQYDPDKDSFVPLPPDATPTAKQFYPYNYKRQPCKFVQKEERCIQGRYCTNDHLGREPQAIASYIERLKREMAADYLSKRQGKMGPRDDDVDYYPGPNMPDNQQGYYAGGPPPGPYHDRMRGPGPDRQRDQSRADSDLDHSMPTSQGDATPPHAMPPYETEMHSFFSSRPPSMNQSRPQTPANQSGWAPGPQGFPGPHPPHVPDFGPYGAPPPGPGGFNSFPPFPAGQGRGFFDGNVRGPPPAMGQAEEYQRMMMMQHHPGMPHMGPRPGPGGPAGSGQGAPPSAMPTDASGVREPDSAFWNFLDDSSESQQQAQQQQQQGMGPQGALMPQGPNGPGGDAFTTMATTLGSVSPFTPGPQSQNFPHSGQSSLAASFASLPPADDLPPNPKNWAVVDVQRWLGSHREEQVRQTALTLARHDVDGELLVTLDDTILKELGIGSWGQRRKLLRAIEEQKIASGLLPSGSQLPPE
eukprot:comp24085_c2_seq1/m.43392 comp24085_c2_seq1/g.43392  ORF comp24085_c2_seq1/g.43392 comp24085_c2_seq1/m.43392 type:complete len:677 (-) comp24085_c2_seq1:778-2808(-)